jgi:hypothetical protein
LIAHFAWQIAQTLSGLADEYAALCAASAARLLHLVANLTSQQYFVEAEAAAEQGREALERARVFALGTDLSETLALLARHADVQAATAVQTTLLTDLRARASKMVHEGHFEHVTVAAKQAQLDAELAELQSTVAVRQVYALPFLKR